MPETSARRRRLPLPAVSLPNNLPAVPSRYIRHLLLALCLVLGPALLPAAETAPPKDAKPADAAKLADPAKPADAPKAAEAAVTGPVVELPIVQITQDRIRKLDKEIGRIDKLIIREQAKVKSSDLDRALNNEKLAHAAAIFGGNSSEHLSAVAASRVTLLEAERSVLEDMKRPGTAAALAQLEAELEQLRVTRRNLDDAAKQR